MIHNQNEGSNGPKIPISPIKSTSTGVSLKDWERKSAIRDDFLEPLAKIQSFCESRLLPQKFLKEKRHKKSESQVKNEELGIISEEGIRNLQQFYSWYESIEKDNVEEEEYNYRMETLNTYRNHCVRILEEVEAVLKYLEDLEGQYQVVAKKTGELHQACEDLVVEQDEMEGLCNSIEKKLAYFNELPQLTSRLSLPSLSVYDNSFQNILQKLDSCIDFISKHKNYREAETYLLKYKQLQNRGLTLVKNEIVSSLKNITAQILNQMKDSSNTENNNLNATNPNETETLNSTPSNTHNETYFYVKFRTVASKLKPLAEEIEKRSKIREYSILLDDCHSCYFEQRLLLLGDFVNYNVMALCSSSEGDLCTMMRTGCMYLMGVCRSEYQLFHHFFNTKGTGLTLLLEKFSSNLYYSYRPLYIRCRNIETLCQLVYLLRTEIIMENLDSQGDSVESFRPIVNRMLQDVQVRLAFLVQTFIRDEISGYLPTDDDLNYPEKLHAIKPDSENTKPLLEETTLMPYSRAYYSWYPTLERTLVCLSKLYLTVENNIFEGLATEAVDACSYTLVFASKLVSTKKSILDGQLFLIKHLLILREQITPFDVSFSIIEQSLDFNYLRNVLKNIISGPSSVFYLNSQNPLVAMMSLPIEILKTDSKKELEKGLRGAIEVFIVSTVKTSLDPLVSFLTKASAFINSNQEHSMRMQAFASPANLNLLLDDISKNLTERLEPILSRMCEYIPNTATQAILYRPISDQMCDSIEQLNRLINTQYLPDDRIQINRDKLILLSDQIRNRLQDKKNTLKTPVTEKSSNLLVAGTSDASVEIKAPPALLQGSPKLNQDKEF